MAVLVLKLSAFSYQPSALAFLVHVVNEYLRPVAGAYFSLLAFTVGFLS
jgi:hypothetical protein